MSNLSQRSSSISWDELPNLFQDAVRICRRLQISYLWIDSLCILQDNIDDWQTESAKMALYYEGALLTISATMSPDSTVPFLTERPSEWLPKGTDFVDDNGETRIVYGRRYARDNEARDLGPLVTRAWTWQESVLSSRLVHYTPAEIIWECDSKFERESGARPDLRRGNYYGWFYDNYEEGPDMRMRRALRQISKSDSITSKAQLWSQLVSTYCSRELTYQTDRLLALSGVASRFQAGTHLRYLAGLWEEYLPLHLCWYQERWNSNQLPFSPSEYIAPSWSWASLGAPISIKFLDSYIFSPLATVVDIQCNVAGANPYGRLSDGTLTLRGKVVDITLSCTEFVKSGTYTIPQASFYPDCCLREVDGSLQRASEGRHHPSFSAQVFTVLLGMNTPLHCRNKEALLLVLGRLQNANTNKYRRLGLAFLDQSRVQGWFLHASEKILSIA